MEVVINLLDKVRLIADTASEKKAENTIAIDLRKSETTIVDAFVITSAPSERQVTAIVETIRLKLKENDIIPLHIEGKKLSQWVLMDYGDIIVHVFLDKTRDFYRLEDLWHQASRFEL